MHFISAQVSTVAFQHAGAAAFIPAEDVVKLLIFTVSVFLYILIIGLIIKVLRAIL